MHAIPALLPDTRSLGNEKGSTTGDTVYSKTRDMCESKSVFVRQTIRKTEEMEHVTSFQVTNINMLYIKQ
jgi:hypothetical protein